jgi:hypothetical protein
MHGAGLAARGARLSSETTGAGYRAEIEAVYAAVDEWQADVSAELHFNAATTPSISGTETWYATDAGRAVAARVNAALVGVLGLPNRSIKRTGKGMAPGIDGTRGYESLICGRCPAVLVETYFGSNAGDCRARRRGARGPRRRPLPGAQRRADGQAAVARPQHHRAAAGALGGARDAAREQPIEEYRRRDQMAVQPDSWPTRKLATVVVGAPTIYAITSDAVREVWPTSSPPPSPARR